MNARLPVYLGPTPNPCADAERWENECERLDEIKQEAEREAPLIVLSRLRALKPGEWFDMSKFYAGHSAEDILRDAMDDSDDAVTDAYPEFMTASTPEAKQTLLQAMANWFSQRWAYEIYTEHLEALS